MALPPPISPVDVAALATRPAPDAAVASAGMGPVPQTPQALIERFQQVYDAPQASVARTDASNVVSNVLSKHQEAIEHEQKEMARLMSESPHLSPVELQVRTMEIAHAAALNGFRMQVGVALAGGINKSLKTLLTNGQG